MPLTEVAAGSVIAGYRIEELAGRGGMGVVYRATQLALDRQVALKLIAPEFANDALFRQRFKRESRLAASIDHPNVIPVHEAGDAEGLLFISMRWVEGTDLDTLVRRGGGLDPERAVALVAQVGAALDAAHARGLIHRDVKPANVLVVAGPIEHVYLTDFGLVKRLRASVPLTHSGQLLGTLDYVAPEQIQQTGGDARSDVYSLGCVLFHCLTGRVPFEADDEVAKIYAHLNDSPSAPSELVPGVPPALDLVVAHAMAKEPARRYASAGELGRAAVEAAQELSWSPALRSTAWGGGTGQRPAQANGKHPVGRAPPRLRWAVGLVLVAAGIVGIVALASPFGDGDNRQPGRSAGPAPIPADGTLLHAPGSSRVYVVKAGAKFSIPRGQRTVFGYTPEETRTISAAALGDIPDIPREGSLVRPYGSTIIWAVEGGQRQLAGPPGGADVAIIPSTGLRQIPGLAGGRKTMVVLVAPSSVQEGRTFRLAARVRSPKGVPGGACVFYRIDRARLRERANTPTRNGRCEARLRVGGRVRVRYSVHFVGDRGWRGSTAATRPIHVQAR